MDKPMKQLNSILALILSLVLIIGCAACGGSADTQQTQEPQDSAVDTETTPTDESGTDIETSDTVNVLSLTTYDMYAQTVDPIEATLTINIGITDSIGNSFNPVGENGTLVPESLRMLVYDFLWGYDADNNNEMYSRILEDWYQQDDNTFVMVLREGIYFQTRDGKYAEMTGEDILFSMESYITQGSQLQAHFLPYNFDESYVSEDGLTVYLKSDEPYGPSVRTIPIICKKWVEENGWDSELWVTDPCSSGPYTSGSFASGASISVTLRETPWWNYDYRQTPVKEFVCHVYNELSTMYIDLETGSIDLAISLDSTDYERALADTPENVIVEKTTSGKMWFLGLGGSSEQNQYLADEKVREAIAYAVDWDTVAEACFGILYSPVTGIISPSSPYYTEGLVEQYPYDPDLAKSILEEAGYSAGEIVFNNVNFGAQAKVAEAIQGYLSAVGITMEVETYDFLTAMYSWMGVGEPPADTAFNDQTDATGEPCDNLGYYSIHTQSAFPVLVCQDETWNDLYYSFKFSKDGRQDIADEMVTYVHNNYLFYPIGICGDCYGYRSDVISDANFFSTLSGGPDFGLISYVGY
jgi:peptide/nickel transport system substrate-binding protein